MATRQEIIDAHEELEKLCKRVPATRHAKATILNALPPIPQPTMADIEWDDKKHYLAEAEHDYWGKVIMLYRKKSGDIQYFLKNDEDTEAMYTPACLLTPTNKRYTLTEVENND